MLRLHTGIDAFKQIRSHVLSAIESSEDPESVMVQNESAGWKPATATNLHDKMKETMTTKLDDFVRHQIIKDLRKLKTINAATPMSDLKLRYVDPFYSYMVPNVLPDEVMYEIKQSRKSLRDKLRIATKAAEIAELEANIEELNVARLNEKDLYSGIDRKEKADYFNLYLQFLVSDE